MPDKLQFKIGAIDDTGKAFESAKKQADSMLKKYKEFSKIGLTPSGEHKSLKKMDNQFKNIIKKMDKMNKTSRRSSTKRAQTGGIIGKAIADAETIKKRGKDVFDSSKKQEQKLDQANQITIKNVDKLNITNIKDDKPGGGGRGKGRGRGKGGGGFFNFDKDTIGGKIAQGISSVGKTLPYAGAALAATGALYAVISSQARAFRQTAGSQIKTLQQIGMAPGMAGGFLAGYEGLGIAGSEQAQLLGAYAGRTGRVGPMFQRKGMFNVGRSRFGQQMRNLAMISSAYGIGTAQVGQQAGDMDRFELGEKKRRMGIYQSILAAERSGMGGARLPEFLDSVSQSLTEAVHKGSLMANDDIINSLSGLMKGSDERIKTIAPEIMRSAHGVFSQAAGLEGGPGAGFAMQAVWQQMRDQSRRQGKGPVSFWDVRQRLASGSTIENMKAIVQGAQKLFPENKQMAEFMIQRTGIMGSVTDPRTVSKIVNLVSQYDDITKSKSSKATVEKEVTDLLKGRIGKISPQMEVTLVRNVKDEQMRLTEANRTATLVVDKFKDSLQGLVNKLEGFAKTLGILPDIEVKLGSGRIQRSR